LAPEHGTFGVAGDPQIAADDRISPFGAAEVEQPVQRSPRRRGRSADDREAAEETHERIIPDPRNSGRRAAASAFTMWISQA
jgi:hypothetical protein